MLREALTLAAALGCALSAQCGTIVFNFDSGSPALTPTTPLPVDQTVGGLKASFTGPFSIQNSDQPYVPSNLSGNFLLQNVSQGSLTISFDQLLTGISFDFATPDFGSDTNSSLRLTAFNGSNATLPVGSGDQLGSFDAPGGWGLGTLLFTSATPFNLVNILVNQRPQLKFSGG